VRLAQDGSLGRPVLNAVGSLLLCLAAVTLGIMLAS